MKILVTAALPYANGPIHLGHLAGAYLPADIYVRYQRLKGRDVLFLCGSDEHGVPITLTADKEGISPQQVVDRYHEANRSAFEKFNMSFDMYSRTSIPLHHETAKEFLLDFYRRGILREKKVRQFFDPKAGMFLPDRYVGGTCPRCGNQDARGDQCEKCGSYLSPEELIEPRSMISGEVPELRETSHLYFPLGDYQRRLEEYVEERDRRDGWKENVLQYCRSWFKDGLQDRAVTRDLDWGVRIPIDGFEQKVIYVWFDAVLGYVSAAKEWGIGKGKPDMWKQYWLDPTTKYVAFIGKDNIVFHCIVFPAMLMAWNDGNRSTYVLPENVPANEFLNFEGQKFSKSRGWGIDVNDFLAKYPADTLRYYLTTALPEYRDSDFYWREFQARTNNELADVFGNFVNRTTAFATTRFEGKVPALGELNDIDRSVLETLRRTPVTAGQMYEQYRFREGLLEVMNLARAGNRYFDNSEPWRTAKTDPLRCATTINISLQIVRSLAVLIEPVVPETSATIIRMLNVGGKQSAGSWDAAGELLLPENHPISKPGGVLINKIEDAVIDEQLKSLASGAGSEEAAPAGDPLIDIGDFQKVRLKVAKILECRKVEKSKKLLKLRLQMGNETRQIIAGIAQHYEPEALVGKSVVVVANLKPATLFGEVSEGMLLAASDGGERLVIIAPETEIAPGSVVK